MKYNELRSVHHFKDSLVEGEEEGEGRGRGETVNKYYRQLASVCALAMDTQVCTVTSTSNGHTGMYSDLHTLAVCDTCCEG